MFPLDKYPEKIDRMVVEEVIRAQEAMETVMPVDSMLQSVLLSSFGQLTGEQRSAIIEKLGVDWYLTLARKLERQLNAQRKRE